MILIFSSISIILYLIVSFMLWQGTYSGCGKPTRTALLIWFSAILTHGSALIPEIITGRGIDLSLFNASSLSGLLISLILFITCLRQAFAAIGVIILPVIALCIIFEPIETTNYLVSSTISSGMQLHIISSLLAYSLLILASIQALMMHRQIKYLKIKDHSKHHFIATLPTLDVMESFLFTLIRFGILLFTVGLISGWIYHEDLFAQHLVHKTVLSVIAWIVFGIVIIGKQLYGWRTNTAVGLILIATTLLILAYLGSKFVLEVVLDKI